MVTITVYVEGGSFDFPSNSEALRESMNRIFTQLLDREVTIKIAAGYRNAMKLFNSADGAFAFVDLDASDTSENRQKWFNERISPIVIAANNQERVFFMVQEMEAWILKQPNAIENWGKRFVRTDTSAIENHSLIRGKDVENIEKPSDKLYDIIKHFFSQSKTDGRLKKVQYGKLKHAPSLLDCLNVRLLKSSDTEIRRFCKHVNN